MAQANFDLRTSFSKAVSAIICTLFLPFHLVTLDTVPLNNPFIPTKTSQAPHINMFEATVRSIASLCGTFLFLTTMMTALRFLARYKQNARLLPDDWLIVSAWICFVGLTGLTFYGISQRFFGCNQPKDTNVLNAQHPLLEKVLLSLDGIAILTLGLVKLSALFFFPRLFCAKDRRDALNLVTIFFIIVVSTWTIVFLVMTYNLCGHHSVAWAVQAGHIALCKLSYPYFKATSISDVILEVMIMAVPLPKIWTLNMITRRKLAVTGVFSFALVGLAAGIMRMVVYLDNAANGTHVMVDGKIVNKAKDSYQTQATVVFCIILETGFTIVAVNMLSLWYFVAGITLEGVLRSVQGLVSLGSGRGSHSNSIRPTTRDQAKTGRSLDSTASGEGLTNKGDASTVESYAMNNLNGNKTAQDTGGV